MGENRKIYAALLGAGTVGSGVYKLAGMQEEDICLKTGAQLEIKKILVRNPGKVREGIPQELFTDSWQEILEDPEIQIVIEVMGGIEPARTYVEEAMKAGKQVVTANKDLLAEYGDPLFEIATENKCDLQFEAAVAGAIPIIRPLRQSLAGSQLTEIMGIVNGTTNYILTKMSEEGMGYQEALDMATRLGYAEADPTADVEGYDAGRKIAIMASIAFSSRVTFPQVYTEGITKITAEDIRYAKEFGYVIKLLGITKLTGKGIEVKVHPTLIPDSHPLATVRDSFNAVFVHGQACDDAMFMGRGAGQMPTASAVLGDVIDVMRNIIHGSCGKIGSDSHKKLLVLDVEETKSRFFLRLQVENRAGALANIAGVLGNNDVSIACFDHLGSHVHAVQTGTAHHVDGDSRGLDGQASLQSSLTSDVLAQTGLNDAAHVDMIDLLGSDVCTVQSFLDDDGAQLNCGNVGQGAAELADSGTACRCDNDLFHVNSLLNCMCVTFRKPFYQNALWTFLQTDQSLPFRRRSSNFSLTAFSTLGVTNLPMSLP